MYSTMQVFEVFLVKVFCRTADFFDEILISICISSLFIFLAENWESLRLPYFEYKNSHSSLIFFSW